MRKFSFFLLTAVMAISLSACGDDKTGTNPAEDADNTSATSHGTDNSNSTTPGGAPNGSDSVPDGQAMASLIAWMMGGTFSYDYTMTSEGPEGKTEGSGSMATDGKNLAMTSETTVEGQAVKSRVIVKDDATYIIDDANKFIMKSPGGMNPTEGMMTDYSGIAKTGDGTGEINGKTLPYEEYAEGETGATVRYYLDGGQVYGIESEYEGYKTVMIITNPSNGVPADAFDLPEGYTQM
jgi:hypothetical protein